MYVFVSFILLLNYIRVDGAQYCMMYTFTDYQLTGFVSKI